MRNSTTHPLAHPYGECSVCQTIKTNGQGKAARINECPYCEEEPQYGWYQWPPEDVAAFVDLAVSRSHEEIPLRTLLIATALESLLEDLLICIFYWQYGRYELVEMILDANRGFEKRAQLFKTVCGISLQEAFTKAGYPTFFQEWKKIVQVRNAFAHAKIAHPKPRGQDSKVRNPSPSRDDLESFQRAITDAFAALRNSIKPKVDHDYVKPRGRRGVGEIVPRDYEPE